MKNYLYKVLVVLTVFALAACQAGATAENQATEFFAGTEQAISVKPPAGWVAKVTGSSSSPSIVVTNDWPGYQNTDPNAFGIIILPLTDKGSAEKALRVSIRRFQEKELLIRETDELRLEQSSDQSYAWVEFQGKSIQESGFAAYFLAVVSKDERNVLVFTAVAPDKQEVIRPAYQSIVKAITLH
jgi:hypothetical protein